MVCGWTEAAAAVQALRRHRPNRLTDLELRMNAALNLGLPAFWSQTKQTVICPDIETDLTSYDVACGSMDIAVTIIFKELDADQVVTSCKDAYPHDHRFTVSPQFSEAINHRADACVYDSSSLLHFCL